MTKSRQSDKPLSVFLHIPKTGGTALHTEITSELLPSEHLKIHPSNHPSKAAVTRHLCDIKLDHTNSLRFIYGHSIYYGIHSLLGRRRAEYSTFLRNPATLYVSLYNHALVKLSERDKSYLARPIIDNGRILSFQEWFKNNKQIHGFQTQYICSFKHGSKISEATSTSVKEAKQILNMFSVIGTTERLSESAHLISRQLGVSKINFGKHNISPRYYNPINISEVEELMTTQEAQHDVELYHYACRLRTSRLAFSTMKKCASGE